MKHTGPDKGTAEVPDSMYPQFAPGPGRGANLSVRRVVACVLAALLPVGAAVHQRLLPVEAQSQSIPNQNCVSTISGQSVPVNSDGSFVIPNVPTSPGNFRVRVTCQSPDGTTTGSTSAFLPLIPLTFTDVPPLPLTVLGPTDAQNSMLEVYPLGFGTLSSAGATVQLEVRGTNPSNFTRDLTLASTGTTYSSSKSSVATVSPDGLVTAVGSGNVTITARNDGLVATAVLPSFALLDSDGDGMPDAYEIANGLNPYDPSDGNLDPDGDGLTNVQEYQLGTNPHVADTDGDGLSDGQEVQIGTNPLVADTDGDGLSDGDEVRLGTNPLSPDTDGDGIPDGVEVKIGTNPLVPDTTTAVIGHVLNPDGTPAVGASVVVLTYFNAVTDTTGAYSISYVPITLGAFSASAEASVNNKIYSASSKTVTPVGNGLTDMGTIQLGQSAGQVSGQIQTPDGKPSIGAVVTVTDGADTRTAITDGSGLYNATGLQPGAVLVTAIDPSTSFRGSATGVLSGAAPLAVNIRLGSFGSVAGTIRNANSTPVGAGATVTIVGSLNSTTTTDALGHYSFSFVPLGAIQLDATDANGNHGRTTGFVTATAQTVSEDVTYLSKGTVTGVVSDSTGNPVGGINVQYSDNGTFGGNGVTATNASGQFTFSNVFFGGVNLSTSYPGTGTAGYASTAITTDGQTVTANITLQPAGTLSGTVFRADGTTIVPGATISFTNSGATAVANANGIYSVPFLPLGTYSIQAADPGSGDRGAASAKLVTSGVTVTQNVTMLGLGTVNVTVVDGGGNPVPGAYVNINSNDPFYITQNAMASSAGTLTFSQQLAGNETIKASSPVTALGGTAQTTLVANGTNAVTVQLQASGTIQGTVFKADKVTPAIGINVALYGGQSTTTDVNGQYSFTVVPTGVHYVQVSDSTGNLLAQQATVPITTQGQIAVQNFTIIGRGTVFGYVRNPDGTPAIGLPVILQPSGDNAYGAITDANGLYTIQNVPVGGYSVNTQAHNSQVNSYGMAAGTLTKDGGSVETDIVLTSTLIPTSQLLLDANGQSYPINQAGVIADGTYSVFASGSAFFLNATPSPDGASVLSLVQGAKETIFTGAGLSTPSLGARQLSIQQNGLDGLNVTRRVFVPADGYFARYLELLNNPGSQDVTVDVKVETNYGYSRQVTSTAGGTTQSNSPAIILQTSSGDQLLNVTDPNNPDHWVVISGPTDLDPFLSAANGFARIGFPPVADVFDGPGAALAPASATYTNNTSGQTTQMIYTYSSVKVPAGSTVGILHFISEENRYAGGIASATRLEQLPPEALAGLTASDLSSIANFVVPPNGASTVPPLPGLNNQISGFVYAADATTAIPYSGVSLQSTDPIFARVYSTAADGTGAYVFQGSLGGPAIPAENFVVTATHPVTSVISPAFTGSFPANSSNTSQDIAFTNTGTIHGVVAIGSQVLNADGTVTISSGSLSQLTNPTANIYSGNSVTLPIQSDGTFTLTGAPVGSYTLTAQVSGTLLTGTVPATVTAPATTNVTINIEPFGSVSGTVTRSDNSLAIGDTVYLRLAGGSALNTLVDTGGRYLFTSIPTGTYTVQVYDQQTNSAASVGVSVNSNTTTTQNLVMTSTGTVTGTVTANDGSSVANLTVTLTGTTSSGVQTLTTTTNSVGFFTFSNVKTGSVNVHTMNAAGLQASGNGGLPLAGTTANINIALTAVGTLTGTVFQANGTTPAAGVQVTLSPAPFNGSANTTTDSNGVYNYTGVSFGQFTVTATNAVTGDRGASNGQIQFNGQARTINVTLNGFASITVKVVDSSSHPVANAAVVFNAETFNNSYSGTSDTTGTAVFPKVPAGYYYVTAKDPVTGLNNATSGSLVANSNVTVTITLQPVGTIKGIVYQPDGVTPAPGITVSSGSYNAPNQVTASDGSFTFYPIALNYYALKATDSSGVERAYVYPVILSTNGGTVTQNLTLIGAGTVTGTITNIDGTPAVGVSLTVTSLNPTVGASQVVTTSANGIYTASDVAIGRITVTANNLPAGEAGFGSGSIATNGSTATINFQITNSTVTLPETLYDADNFGYTIATNGQLSGTGSYEGINGALYDNYPLTITFNSFNPQSTGNNGSSYVFGASNTAPTTAIATLNGQQVEITDPSVNQLSVTRKIYVPSAGYFARHLDVIHNPTSVPATITVSYNGQDHFLNARGNTYPTLVATSNGKSAVDTTTLWEVDDDDGGTLPYPLSQPALATVFAGTGNTLGMSTVTYSPFDSYYYSYGYNSWNFVYNQVTIPPNSSVSFLSFESQEATQPAAINAATRLVQLPPEALAGLTPADLASIVNFVVPTTQTLTPPTPPATNSLTGVVVAGDGITPIPNAKVYLQSSDLLYSSGASATADSNGNYSLPATLAQSYVVDAIDPVTNVTSVQTANSFPATTTGLPQSQVQNVPFTGTGILSGQVIQTGQGNFVSGTVYLSENPPCCLYINSAIPSAGTFQFLTIPAGQAQISVNMKTDLNNFIAIPQNGVLDAQVAPNTTTNFSVHMPATGLFSGFVSNADNTPAVGVTVTATPSSVGFTASAVTDSTGHYNIDTVVLDTYTVSAQDPTDGTKVSQTAGLTQDTNTTVNLQFPGKDSLVATVSYANGNPAQNLTLYLTTSANPNSSLYCYAYQTSQCTWTNVPVGPFSIKAYYPGQNFFSTTTGTIAGNGQTQNVNVTLTPVGTITGKVINADGSLPTNPTQIYVYINDPTSQYSTYAQLDNAGNFGFFPVPADRTVSLYANAAVNGPNGTQTARISGVQVPGDGQTLTENLRFPGFATVRVHLLNFDGTPGPTNSYIYVSLIADGIHNSQYVYGYTDNTGTATLTNVQEGNFLAVASGCCGYDAGSTTFTVLPASDNTTIDVTIKASPSGTLQGQIFAADGVTPIVGSYYLSVEVNDVTTSNSVQAAITGSMYSATNVQVGAGGYQLNVSLYGGPTNNIYSAQATGNITTQGQVITQNFTLPVSLITGTVFLNDGVTPVPNASVVLYGINGTSINSASATADANGVYQFAGAPVGNFQITATDANGVSGSTQLTINSATQIVTGQNISLQPVGMVLGLVYDTNGNLLPDTQVDLVSDGNSGFQETVFTDGFGYFNAPDVPLGNITATAVDSSSNTLGTATGVLATANQTIGVVINGGPVGITFGTVFDGNGSPLGGVTVTTTANPATNVSLTSITSSGGPNQPPVGTYYQYFVPVGNVTASATLPDGTQIQTNGVVADSITPVEVDLDEQMFGQVSGVVIDLNNNPYPNLYVDVYSSGDGPNNTNDQFVQTDSNGNYIATNITPGTITLTFYFVDSGGNFNQVGQTTGTLPYGGNVIINGQTTNVQSLLTPPPLFRSNRMPAVVASVSGPGPAPLGVRPASVPALPTPFVVPALTSNLKLPALPFSTFFNRIAANTPSGSGATR